MTNQHLLSHFSDHLLTGLAAS